MKATIKKENGYWSVYLDGRLVMAMESYQVASNVAYALSTGAYSNSECDEAARAILAATA